ncbi:MAG: 2-phospho-L-lactate guanylyltransferase [Actinomycetota bacterium]|nr:2-phospho-L-lactate guanylyltransferase [Actinomycetota bacterium]
MPIFETPPWGVVVPVKLLSVAKSRLAPYGEAARRRLALAFAADVVTAAMRSRLVIRVVVVTDDPVAAQALTSIGAVVVADEPAAGLNPALRYGAELLRASLPDCGVAALSSDLPALRADDLDTVLAAVPAEGRAFVPDAERLGTTLLAASPGLGLDPAYGEHSRLRHLDSGAVELPGSAGLQRDVDTPADLATAVALGVGPNTAAAVVGLGLSPRSPAQCTMQR